MRPEPVSHRLALSGLDLHLLEWPAPDGALALPPVLMLHGWLDQAWTFASLAEHLPLRLLAWDARGYGQSGRAAAHDFYHFFDYLWDLQQLLDQLGIEQVILLGHSMGGMVASFFAGTRPERVKALISLEGWIVPDPDPDATPDRVRLWLDQLAQARAPRPLPSLAAATERMLRQDKHLSREQAQALAAHATHPSPDSHEGLLWHYDPRHRMRSPQPFRLDQARAFWRRITCPTLLAWGAESEALALPDWDARLAMFAGASTLELPAAGHNLHLHQPARLGAAIMRWIEDEAVVKDNKRGISGI